MIVDWYGNDLRSIFRKLLMKKNSKSFCKPKYSGLSVIAFLGLIISFCVVPMAMYTNQKSMLSGQRITRIFGIGMIYPKAKGSLFLWMSKKGIGVWRLIIKS